jgi:hydroxyacylglutathione hydrolase
MPHDLEIIGLGGVNCFLLKARDGFVLVDSGFAARRDRLERRLEAAGCRRGDLKLIVLTHGDVDHAGNCTYLRAKYGARIAMHRGDAGMVERGDMSSGRKAKPDRISPLFRVVSLVARAFTPPGVVDVFSPDVIVEDGEGLSEYGLNAVVLHLPGHSKGSIGILIPGDGPSADRSTGSPGVADRALLCGDLFMNVIRPGPHFMINDLADFNASLEKLRGLDIETVYPAHGRPFPMATVLKEHRS